MDDFWGLYIQDAELPIFIGLAIIFVVLPLGLYQAKKRQDSLLVSLKTLAADLGGEFFYKQFNVENLADVARDPDCSEYKIKLDIDGRECVIFPYAYPSHATGRSQLNSYAPWSTVFKLKIKRCSSDRFSLKYKTKHFFLFPWRKNAEFEESNINIENRIFFDKVVSYEELVSFIKNIQFISEPFFEMKVNDDLLYIKVDKVENEITDIRKYLNFLKDIAEKIESNVN